MVISNIYANASDETSCEFIELYNPTASDIDISGWDICDDDSCATPEATIAAGTVPAYGYFLIADVGWAGGGCPEKTSNGWPDADLEDTVTFANYPGNDGVLIRDGDDITIDAVGWGPTATGEGALLSVPSTDGDSFERNPGGDSCNATDTNDNAADFTERNPVRAPKSTASATCPYIDCGLRIWDVAVSTNIIPACEDPDVGTVTSELRVHKNGKTYGVVLKSTDTVKASKIRIKTPSGIKAIQKH